MKLEQSNTSYDASVDDTQLRKHDQYQRCLKNPDSFRSFLTSALLWQGGDDVDEFVEEQFALVLVPGLQHDGLFRIVLSAERRVVEPQERLSEPRRGRRRCLFEERLLQPATA